MTEWRDIPGYDGKYQASDDGQVRGGRNGTKPLKPRSVRGYQSISLSKNGKPFRTGAHRLVLLAFVGPPPTPKHQAAHTNGVRNDNRLVNLSWVTAKENEAHKAVHGTQARHNSPKKIEDADLVKLIKMSEAGFNHRAIGKALGALRDLLNWRATGAGERGREAAERAQAALAGDKGDG